MKLSVTRLYTFMRLVAMNNELETEWVTGMPHKRPEKLTSYSDNMVVQNMCF
jgi:hypothetical protein